MIKASIIVMIILLSATLLYLWYKEYKKDKLQEASILGPQKGSVFSGTTKDGLEVWLKTNQRAMHTQVIGTTNAGKTESVIIPWAVQDIFNGRGILLIDGKADNSLLNKLWSYTVKAGREKDFRLFSLSNLELSHQFNPLVGGPSEEITERVFNSFEFENPHYRSLQYEVMIQVMRILEGAMIIPSFQRLYSLIEEPANLVALALKGKDEQLIKWATSFSKLERRDLENRTSGLLSALSHFSFGERAKLFNPKCEAITLDDAISKNQIVYFQLPVLLSPFLGKATGKMVLQSLQAAVANRHRSGGDQNFFSVFLDDFSEYLYDGFVSILNKSRSANVGIVFAHQALGDIKALGDSTANSILTNSNIKVFMRNNDPESAEYFAKTIGTVEGTKETLRHESNLIGKSVTGDGSTRDVEQYPYHPNKFKRDLGIGQAIMIIPHEKGAKTIEIKFNKIDDLPKVQMQKLTKEVLPPLEIIQTKQSTTQSVENISSSKPLYAMFNQQRGQ